MGFSNINRRSKLVSTALAASFALGALGMAATPALAQKKEKAAKPGKLDYSKPFLAAAAPLEAKLKTIEAAKAKVTANDPAGPAEFVAATTGAAALLEAVGAVAKSPDERYYAGQSINSLGDLTKDTVMRQRGIKAMIDSGKVEAARMPTFHFVLGQLAYENKDYPGAASAFALAVSGNYSGSDAGEIMVDAYAKAGQPGQGLSLLKQAIEAKQAAGQPVPENWLRRANVIAIKAKLRDESIDWASMQVESYPNNLNWLTSANSVRNSSNYGPNETIDLFRLMLRAGAFDTDPKLLTDPRVLGREYSEYIEAADPRKLPGEVIRVIDKGTASGALTGQWVTDNRALANSRMAADKAALPAAAAKAAKSSIALDAQIAGDVYLNYGDAAKAEELYKLALGKSGVEKDRVLTRLGIAQFDQAKYADARASFKQVGGTRAPLARLWLALVNSKSPAA